MSVAHAEAVVGEVAGRAVALRYAGTESEYAALRQTAMLVDRSQRGRMSFEGDKRVDTLTGLVTNDVAALSPGMTAVSTSASCPVVAATTTGAGSLVPYVGETQPGSRLTSGPGATINWPPGTCTAR